MSEDTQKRPIFKNHPLEFPITVDGVTYTEIPLRRLTARQVQDWLDQIRDIKAKDPAAKVPDVPVIDAAPEVLGELDDDDFLALEEAAVDFLPRRFRADSEMSIGSPSSSVKPTAPSSAETSAGV